MERPNFDFKFVLATYSPKQMNMQKKKSVNPLVI